MTDKREVELPELDISESDCDEAQALTIPPDLMPDSNEAGPWIVKMTLWMGSARVCRERQLLAALRQLHMVLEREAATSARYDAKISQLEQLLNLPDENDPLIVKMVDSATFDSERQRVKSGGTIGDWMRRAEAAEARVAQLEQQILEIQGNEATKDKPTFAYDLAMYLTKNGRELATLTIEEMQYRIENFVYRSCWEVREK